MSRKILFIVFILFLFVFVSCDFYADILLRREKVTLEIIIEPAGAGWVELDPYSNDGRYTVNTRVYLSPNACTDNGYVFDYWEGDVATETTTDETKYFVFMNTDKQIKAIFKYVAPIVNNKEILVSNVIFNDPDWSLNLYWKWAIDDDTLPGEIKYYVYKSEDENICNLTDVLKNGTILNAEGENIIFYYVDGLTSGKQYWFNIIAEDKNGNKAIYDMVKIPVLEETYTINIAIDGSGTVFLDGNHSANVSSGTIFNAAQGSRITLFPNPYNDSCFDYWYIDQVIYSESWGFSFIDMNGNKNIAAKFVADIPVLLGAIVVGDNVTLIYDELLGDLGLGYINVYDDGYQITAIDTSVSQNFVNITLISSVTSTNVTISSDKVVKDLDGNYAIQLSDNCVTNCSNDQEPPILQQGVGGVCCYNNRVEFYFNEPLKQTSIPSAYDFDIWKMDPDGITENSYLDIISVEIFYNVVIVTLEEGIYIHNADKIKGNITVNAIQDYAGNSTSATTEWQNF